VLTVEDEPLPAEPDESSARMSWWKRTWITMCVLVAIAVTSTGVVLVRKVLDHSVDPQTLLNRSADRLTTLDPAFPGLDVTGDDTVASVDCKQASCARASRHFRPTARMTASTLIAEADSWASISGLGAPTGGVARRVDCGALSHAPVDAVLCDLGSYAVPGQADQRVDVYAQLSAKGKAPSSRAFSLAQVGRFAVGSVYIQVMTSTQGP
jgi:hypothetical protein